MRFYKVSVRGSENRNKLRWWEARSKNYANLTHALNKMEEYKRMGMEPVLYRSPEFEWEQVEVDTVRPV